MLYSEFLEGTKAVNNEATYAEYKRVEQIYMAADMMTKEDEIGRASCRERV